MACPIDMRRVVDSSAILHKNIVTAAQGQITSETVRPFDAKNSETKRSASVPSVSQASSTRSSPTDVTASTFEHRLSIRRSRYLEAAEKIVVKLTAENIRRKLSVP